MPPRKTGYSGRVANVPGAPTLPEILSAGGQSLDSLRSEAATCEAFLKEAKPEELAHSLVNVKEFIFVR